MKLRQPIDSVETPAFELFDRLCGYYEWTNDPGRAQSRKILEAIIDYFSYDASITDAMRVMYAGALEDARTGRNEAELENLKRSNVKSVSVSKS
jgi:hypothetical protein